MRSGIPVSLPSGLRTEQAMNNVIPFDPASRLAAQAERFEQQRRELEETGNHAWGNLKRARKLKANDRREIARALHELLEELKQRPSFSIGRLVVAADLGHSKELYRLTLPPGEDPIKRGLRADAQKYVRLLKAVQRLTGSNIGQLADRLTWGTSLHPKQAQGTGEPETVATYLQDAIIRIDNEFRGVNGGDSLFDTFMKAARIKADKAREAARLKVPRRRWPYYDREPGESDYRASSDEGHPAQGPEGPIPAMPDDYIPRAEDDFDVRYAYWERDYGHVDPYSRVSARAAYASQLAHHDALMFLPRIYLGVVDSDTYFSQTEAEKDAVRHCETHTAIQFEPEPGSRQRQIEGLRSCVGELAEIRDPDTGEARIAHRHRASGEWVPGPGHSYGREYHGIDESVHVWLVIYPSPDNTNLLPVLYQPMEEGGTLLTPLNRRSLASLRELPFVDAGEPRSLYDLIKELMRASSDRAIYRAWQETAKDVLMNPLLRAHRDDLARQDDFERGVAGLWDDK